MAPWLWTISGGSLTGRRPLLGMLPTSYAFQARRMRSPCWRYETRMLVVSQTRIEESLDGEPRQTTGVQPGMR